MPTASSAHSTCIYVANSYIFLKSHPTAASPKNSAELSQAYIISYPYPTEHHA